MLTLKVINIFGAPGVGKSTTATGLFNVMKLKGLNVEYVSEFAKDLTWGKDWMGLSHQLSILAEQDYRLRRLEGQVEWVITDSPLPLQIAYMGDEWLNIGLDRLAWDAFDRYDNYSVLIQRNAAVTYQMAGRNQTMEQAMMLDNVIDNLYHTAALDNEDFCFELMAQANSPWMVYDWLMENEYGAD